MKTNSRTLCPLFFLATLITLVNGERSFAQLAMLPTRCTKASMAPTLPCPPYSRLQLHRSDQSLTLVKPINFDGKIDRGLARYYPASVLWKIQRNQNVKTHSKQIIR